MTRGIIVLASVIALIAGCQNVSAPAGNSADVVAPGAVEEAVLCSAPATIAGVRAAIVQAFAPEGLGMDGPLANFASDIEDETTFIDAVADHSEGAARTDCSATMVLRAPPALAMILPAPQGQAVSATRNGPAVTVKYRVQATATGKRVTTVENAASLAEYLWGATTLLKRRPESRTQDVQSDAVRSNVQDAPLVVDPGPEPKTTSVEGQ